ncbi:MAG TPA: sulfatase-like hydrolase/transferase [Pseudolabrys sp.]|nr:sulfatase-like hydrolase/transferase [Pseudolabrys sp.]
MLSAASALLSRLAPAEGISRRDAVALSAVAGLHVVALIIMVATEVDLVAKVAFLLTWALLNLLCLAALRRPIASALVSLSFIIALILLSQFKHEKLWMTVDFVDLLIIDRDTSAFLLAVIPGLRTQLMLVAFAVSALIAIAWRLDPFRMRLGTSASAGTFCLAALTVLSLSFPTDLYEDFFGRNYVSKFARTGIEAMHELITHGYLDSKAAVTEQLKVSPVATCVPARKLPHVILLHDESSFDITAVPGINVPPGYRRHFRSFDGKMRKLIVEGAGGPSWFTEYNVLTGLSARSFGRFATSVTRVAAGRVERGLPASLARCGYKTFSLYPFYGAFLSSRAFQTTAGIGRYLDMADLGTENFERDSFYFDKAEKIIARERGDGPLFLYVYTVANHFPWDTRLRPELTPNWRDLGNAPNVDEYIRRQGMTAQEYAAFLERLRRDFPSDSFLIVRYGDHQPEFAHLIIDPGLSDAERARQLKAHDPRYFTSYYAVDTVNFKAADMSSAFDTLEAPYLPLLVQEAAGVPLDPSFLEQKKILQRCKGAFYACAGGEEARRFNRLLIEAGLIKGL